MQVALDVGVLLSAFALAYLFRFEFSIPKSWWGRALEQAPFVVGLQLLALAAAGVPTRRVGPEALALERALPISRLRSLNPGRDPQIDALVAGSGRSEGGLRYPECLSSGEGELL
jgi:hypothetical protein